MLHLDRVDIPVRGYSCGHIITEGKRKEIEEVLDRIIKRYREAHGFSASLPGILAIHAMNACGVACPSCYNSLTRATSRDLMICQSTRGLPSESEEGKSSKMAVVTLTTSSTNTEEDPFTRRPSSYVAR